MRLSAAEFRSWDNKRITLIGMPGVGKTDLAKTLSRDSWFHYSVDYRIGTRYLDESILDDVKQHAMNVPYLRDLLLSDSIYIANNITVDNLHPVTSFLGMVGDPERGGLSLTEFRRRQNLYRRAEIEALRDVPDFIDKARRIYGYENFVIGSSGSMCDLDASEVIDVLAEHSVVIYLKVSDCDVDPLLDRARAEPQPFFYREPFLNAQLATYMEEQNLPYAALIDPAEFGAWVVPRLLRDRVPRYEAIAEQHGYTLESKDVHAVNSESDFFDLVESVLPA
ncbi:MAG: ATPase [Planctomycetota bacterium]